MRNFVRGVLTGLLLMCGSSSFASSDPPLSIYQLPAVLTDTAGKNHPLDAYRGRPVLVTMFYGSCPAACPLLIDTLRATERALPENERAAVRVLMISIDPERDTPAVLAELAKTRHIDMSRWELASTDAATVRKLAAVLNVQYRKLPDGGYNHTSVITLLDAQGQIVHRSTTIGSADPQLKAAIHETTTAAKR
jgi:protein SCO1